MKEAPGYYAIIPAHVRYDKRLAMAARMMYGEITALSNAKGYCFASNGYFAKLYEVSNQAISKHIKQLERFGYIQIEYIEAKGVQERRIKIEGRITEGGYQPQVEGGINQELRGYQPQVEHNSINIISSLSSPAAPDSIYKDVVEYLNSVTNSKYKASSKKTQKVIHARCEEGFTLDDFCAVIDDRFRRWGSDAKMREYLRPETLFGTKFEGYLQAASHAVSANTDDTLNDCELTGEEQTAYNEYIQYIHAKYMDLYRSECRVLSKADWIDYKNCTSMRGLPNLMNTEARRALLAWAHERLNKDQQFRSQYESVIQCYYTRAKAIVRKEATV